MAAGEVLPVTAPIPTGTKFQAIETPSGKESEPVEIITDAFNLSQGRLFVEQDPESRRWIYTIIDAETGKILSRFPHQFVNNLTAKKGFALGLLFDARA